MGQLIPDGRGNINDKNNQCVYQSHSKNYPTGPKNEDKKVQGTGHIMAKKSNTQDTIIKGSHDEKNPTLAPV